MFNWDTQIFGCEKQCSQSIFSKTLAQSFRFELIISHSWIYFFNSILSLLLLITKNVNNSNREYIKCDIHYKTYTTFTISNITCGITIIFRKRLILLNEENLFFVLPLCCIKVISISSWLVVYKICEMPKLLTFIYKVVLTLNNMIFFLLKGC